MTGEEFLNKVRAIKQITGIEWKITGELLDADVAELLITADGKQFSILLGYPKTTFEIDFMQEISIRLIINKLLDQEGISKPLGATSNLTDDINYAIQIMKGGKHNEK